MTNETDRSRSRSRRVDDRNGQASAAKLLASHPEHDPARDRGRDSRLGGAAALAEPREWRKRSGGAAFNWSCAETGSWRRSGSRPTVPFGTPLFQACAFSIGISPEPEQQSVWREGVIRTLGTVPHSFSNPPQRSPPSPRRAQDNPGNGSGPPSEPCGPLARAGSAWGSPRCSSGVGSVASPLGANGPFRSETRPRSWRLVQPRGDR